MAYKRLGDLLVAFGTINEEQLEAALEGQKGTGKRLGEYLVDTGVINETQLFDALQMQLGVDFIDLTSISLPIELAKLVPHSLARKFNIVPVRLEMDKLYIAMSDPLDFVAQEEVKSVSKKSVIPMVAKKRDVEQAIMTLYSNEGSSRAIEEMLRESGGRTAVVQSGAPAEGTDDSAPAIRFVNSVIERAYSERASDIHLEPQENMMVVRMRIDGLLRKMLTVPTELQNTVTSRLKIIGGMNISERRIPQDGHAAMSVRGHDIDLRINTLPTVHGEKIVLRILDKNGSSVTKNSIGLEGDDLEKYESLLKNSSGVILLVGPTGSGKSTTLLTMLQELACEETNIVTLEDPVEYNIPGVNQCQINEKTGMTFAAGLRAILRQDPDVISVGEIRDGETGSIAIRAAITGHLVFSTLHTNDAPSAFARLKDIGVEPYLTVSAMRGIISQRLVRKLCPNCREAYKPSVEELDALGLPADSDVQFYRSTGCPECAHTGYRGRTAAFEILMVDADVRHAVTEGGDSHDIMVAARKNGFKSMRESCTSLVLRGVTGFSEAFKAISSTEE